MNIVLFEAEEMGRPLARSDARAEHVLKVLGRREGETFDAGIVNGDKGKARIESLQEKELRLSFDLGTKEPPLFPVDVVVGLSRPQTNRRILREAAALGARRIDFVRTARGEPSYADSKLWTTGEWRRQLVSGAAQAFSTRIPEVQSGSPLEETIDGLAAKSLPVVLDNYESCTHLMDIDLEAESATLVVGSERGWNRSERAFLRSRGFLFAHLGTRPLRTETALTAGLSMIIKGLGGAPSDGDLLETV